MSWSRDGLRLAYMRLRPLSPERARIERSFVTLLVGSNDEQTLASSDATRDAPYDWSADGKWVMASTDRQSPGRRGIGLFPIAAAPHAETQLRVLTSHPEQNLYQARFSPDDRWVSFIAAKAVNAGISTIHVIPAAGRRVEADHRRQILRRQAALVARWPKDLFRLESHGLLQCLGHRLRSGIGRSDRPTLPCDSL
jgi:Tol biopolymer transport system component